MTYTTLRITREGGVAELTLDRPAALNALTTEMFAELRDALDALAADRAVRVLLVTGAGRGFCAGLDLGDPLTGLHLPEAERGATLARRMDAEVNAMMRKLQGFPKPKVMAINGVAAGGGLGVALAGDIVIAARSASFVATFVPKLGLIPDLGCTWYLPRLVGRARALALAMLGEKLPAEQAAQWGLVWQCVDDAELMPTARGIAVRLAAAPTAAMAELVDAVDRSLGNDYSQQLDYERDANSRLNASADFQEGVAAFGEKRAPQFGR